METRRIGSLEVSVVGLGCNNFGGRLDAAETASVVDEALDAGINFLDTADIYGNTQSETYLGRALRGKRDRVVLATKFGMKVDEERQGARPEYVRQACDDSLRRLETDRIDLYQLHAPDPTVPIADTLGAMDELVKAGKVREIGCSKFSPGQLREAEAAVRPGGARFVSVQNEYSMIHREPEQGVLDECARLGIAFIPYFPLASGLLTGKYRRGQPVPQGTRLADDRFAGTRSEQNLELVERLIAFAAARGHTLLELAFGWLLTRPVVVSVIAGATKPEQVRGNARAAGWRLSSEDLAKLDGILPAPTASS
jgi:aryl-alcohol dehydrogenase-like predicted oxidoreductase